MRLRKVRTTVTVMEIGGTTPIVLPPKEIQTKSGDDTNTLVLEPQTGRIVFTAGTVSAEMILGTSTIAVPFGFTFPHNGKVRITNHGDLDVCPQIAKVVGHISDVSGEAKIHLVDMGHSGRGLIEVMVPPLDQLDRVTITIEPLPDATV